MLSYCFVLLFPIPFQHREPSMKKCTRNTQWFTFIDSFGQRQVLDSDMFLWHRILNKNIVQVIVINSNHAGIHKTTK